MQDPDSESFRSKYPPIIAQMPEVFDAHQFILRLARGNQALYVKKLWGRVQNEAAAPFQNLHNTLARDLNYPPSSALVVKFGDTISPDIFGKPSPCSVWKKVKPEEACASEQTIIALPGNGTDLTTPVHEGAQKMQDLGLTLLLQEYPSIIAQMNDEFDSHEFILRLAKLNQAPYVELLWRHVERRTQAPFRAVHGMLSRCLCDFPSLVDRLPDEPSRDIFGDACPNARWKKKV